MQKVYSINIAVRMPCHRKCDLGEMGLYRALKKISEPFSYHLVFIIQHGQFHKILKKMSILDLILFIDHCIFAVETDQIALPMKN